MTVMWRDRVPARYVVQVLWIGLWVFLPGTDVSLRAQVGETFVTTVVRVADGDTLTVLHGDEQVRIRLAGIDTPETDQPFGTEAETFTATQVAGREAHVHVVDVDRYGRFVSRVTIAANDLSVALVKAGLAWHYRRYSDDPELDGAEDEARFAKRGLWGASSPTAPWDFRRSRRPR